MGTGIVAIAATTLPILGSDQRVFAEVVWVVAVLLLVGVTGAVAAHWLRHPRSPRARQGSQRGPVLRGAAHGVMTVGAGTLLVGWYAMLGLSLSASLIMITMIWSRLVITDPPGRLGYAGRGQVSRRRDRATLQASVTASMR